MGNADGNALPLEPFEQLLEYSTVVMWKSSLASITGMTARVPRAMPPWRAPRALVRQKTNLCLRNRGRASFRRTCFCAAEGKARGIVADPDREVRRRPDTAGPGDRFGIPR